MEWIILLIGTVTIISTAALSFWMINKITKKISGLENEKNIYSNKKDLAEIGGSKEQ